MTMIHQHDIRDTIYTTKINNGFVLQRNAKSLMIAQRKKATAHLFLLDVVKKRGQRKSCALRINAHAASRKKKINARPQPTARHKEECAQSPKNVTPKVTQNTVAMAAPAA